MTSTIAPKLQLRALGPQDRYLTDDSEGTTSFWAPTPIRRATRCALQTLQEPFPQGGLRFGTLNRMTIPLAADVLGGVTLEVRLPAIPGAVEGDTWVPRIGYVLVRRAKVFVQDIMLCDHERLWMYVADALFGSPQKDAARAEMSGGGPLALSLLTEHILHIPLRMPWSSANFFPLCALASHTRLLLEVELEPFANCISLAPGRTSLATYLSPTLIQTSRPGTLVTSSGGTQQVPEGAVGLQAPWDAVQFEGRPVLAASPPPPKNNELYGSLCLLDVAFLDVEEKRALLRGPVVWSFETVMDQEGKTYTESLSSDGGVARDLLPETKVDLSELNAPVRALVWMIYPENFGTQYFAFDTGAAATCRISVNGLDITPSLPATHFQALMPTFRNARATPGLFLHSFALALGSPHPSGALAFDRTKNPLLHVTFTNRPDRPPSTIKVFAIVRRFITIERGMVRFVTL